MSKVIIFTNKNGNVSVCYPSGEVDINVLLSNRDVCPIGALVIDESHLPQGLASTHYFESWRLVGGEISINMDAAKEIHRNMLRQRRSMKWQELDAESGRHHTAYLLANRRKDTAAANAALDAMAAVEDKKQLLRDATDDPAIDAAENLEDLYATIPDSLK